MLALMGGNMRNSIEFRHCEDMSPYPQGILPDKIKVGRKEIPDSYLHDSDLRAWNDPFSLLIDLGYIGLLR